MTSMDAFLANAAKAAQQALGITLKDDPATAAAAKDVIASLQSAGSALLDPKAIAARKGLGDKGVAGFDIGWGTMHSAVTPSQMAALRSALGPDDQHGFDVALALGTGSQKLGGDVLVVMKPSVAAGYAITHGAQTAPAKKQSMIVMTAAMTPGGAIGVQRAAQEIRKLKGIVEDNFGWTDAALVAIGGTIGAMAGGWVWAVGGALVGEALNIIRKGRS